MSDALQCASYSPIYCSSCGVKFWMTQYLHELRRKDAVTFYCPNGHSQVYRDSEADKLRRELNNAKQQIARVEDEKRDALREAEAERKKTARLMRRAKAGLCPCCNRSFVNLHRHMKTKHPDQTKLKAAS